MITIKKSVTLTGNSMIDGVIAECYQAIIDSSNPQNMNITSWQADKAIYKANREQCRLDSAEFEDSAYALQDEMIAEIGGIQTPEAEVLPNPETGNITIESESTEETNA